MSNYLTTYIDEMLQDVHISWKRILLSNALKPVLIECLDELHQDLINNGVTKQIVLTKGINTYLRPNIENIFGAFKHFDANNLSAIIIGQDPYPNKNINTGMCYSTIPIVPIRDNTKALFDALIHHGHITHMPESGDLTGWARQGVLLLNTYLTRSPNIVLQNTYDKSNGIVGGTVGIYVAGIGESTHKFWHKFISALIAFLSGTFVKRVSVMRDQTIPIILCGDVAHTLESSINIDGAHGNKFDIYKYDTDAFIEHDHFQHLQINWNPAYMSNGLFDQFISAPHINLDNVLDQINIYDDGTDSELNLYIRQHLVANRTKKIIVCFTDGGCDKNGHDDAKGAYAVYYPATHEGKRNYIKGHIGGPLKSYHVQYNTDIGEVQYNTEFIKITNIRAETMAALYALHDINTKWDDTITSIIIIIDCTYVINLLTTWIYSWHDTNDTFTHKKNSDIVTLIWNVLECITRKYNNANQLELSAEDAMNEILVCIHQKSHIAKKNYDKWPIENIEGNEVVDKLCTQIMQMDNPLSIYKTYT